VAFRDADSSGLGTAANGALDLRDDLIANIGLGPELQG
jgi:hypothetical protein